MKTKISFSNFRISGDWRNVEISLLKIMPMFSRKIFDKPNYVGKLLEKIAFLIVNNKAESFHLEIGQVTLD